MLSDSELLLFGQIDGWSMLRRGQRDRLTLLMNGAKAEWIGEAVNELGPDGIRREGIKADAVKADRFGDGWGNVAAERMTQEQIADHKAMRLGQRVKGAWL